MTDTFKKKHIFCRIYLPFTYYCYLIVGWQQMQLIPIHVFKHTPLLVDLKRHFLCVLYTEKLIYYNSMRPITSHSKEIQIGYLNLSTIRLWIKNLIRRRHSTIWLWCFIDVEYNVCYSKKEKLLWPIKWFFERWGNFY